MTDVGWLMVHRCFEGRDVVVGRGGIRTNCARTIFVCKRLSTATSHIFGKHDRRGKKNDEDLEARIGRCLIASTSSRISLITMTIP